MSDIVSHLPKPDLSPLRLPSRSIGWQFAAIVLGTVFLAVASSIEVPMLPVPMNMQTFAVTLVGALYGWRLGAITIISWLIVGALGLPVLSGGGAGAHHFVGTTGGYLFAFPIAGALVGWLAERGWNGNRVVLAFAAMLAGNAVCLVLGAAWLAVLIGIEPAVASGVLPFLIGAVLKSALGAATLKALIRTVRSPSGQ